MMKLQSDKILIHILLLLAVLLTIGPFIWMFLTSIKTYEEAIQIPPKLFPQEPQWRNYTIILEKFPVVTLYFNTFVTVAVVVIGQLTISAMAAYAFARLRFPGRDILFIGILSLLMIPGQIYLIPHYMIMAKLRLTNTLPALFIPRLFYVFGVFLLRQFFLVLPQDFDDAAKIDGCNYFQIFYKIILPLSKPGLSALAILTALWTWKELMWPIIVNRSIEKLTLSAGLAFLIGEHTTYYEQVMAGGILAIWPMIIVFFIFQRQFVAGLTVAAIKG
jgi:multiple sugar transport system permease protein